MKDSTSQTQSAPMTRGQMQQEAVIISSLIQVLLALPEEDLSSDAYPIAEMAHSRAQKLNLALDSLYVEEEAA